MSAISRKTFFGTLLTALGVGLFFKKPAPREQLSYITRPIDRVKGLSNWEKAVKMGEVAGIPVYSHPDILPDRFYVGGRDYNSHLAAGGQDYNFKSHLDAWSFLDIRAKNFANRICPYPNNRVILLWAIMKFQRDYKEAPCDVLTGPIRVEGFYDVGRRPISFSEFNGSFEPEPPVWL